MEHQQSYIMRAMSKDGSLRVIFSDTSSLVQHASAIHETSKTCSAVLGRSLTAAALMGSLLKDPDNSLTLQIQGDGPVGKIICVSDYKENVRGYLENPQIELPPNSKGKLNVGAAVGQNGTLYVIKDLGLNDPYIGMTPLVSGEIGDDVTSYFAQSEQIPTVCALGVRVNPDITIKASGGFLLQLLPGADETVIPRIEENVQKLGSISALIEKKFSGTDILSMILESIPFDIFDRYDIDYLCDCDRERYITALCSLSDTDFDEILKEGEPVETVCMFCKHHYHFSPDELRQARSKRKKQ